MTEPEYADARKKLIWALHYAVNLLGTVETSDLVKEVLAEYAEPGK